MRSRRTVLMGASVPFSVAVRAFFLVRVANPTVECNSRDVLARRVFGGFVFPALFVGATVTTHGCQSEGLPNIEPPASCDLEAQKEWIYDTMDEVYLWSTELPPKDEVDFASYDSPEALTTALRQNVDRWTRAVDKVESDALFMAGMRLGIGFKYRSNDDGNLVLKLVHPGSPAGVAGLRRGDVIVSVNGVPSPEASSSDWGENDEGLIVNFEVIPREQAADPNAEPELVPVTRDWYLIITVPNATVLDLAGESVGYFYFDTFVKTSVAELDAAFETFEAAGVTKLVVDLRYNGGGLISTARHLANLLGSAMNDDAVMYKVKYNSNLSEGDNSYRFATTSHALPLERIAFITSGSTSSASELVINAMLPYTDVELIGAATSGKPVGSNSFEFCEKLLYPITFKLLNSLDEGEYFDGLATGCGGDDQPEYELGDPNESLLANALDYLQNGSCSAYQATPGLRAGVDANPADPLSAIHTAR